MSQQIIQKVRESLAYLSELDPTTRTVVRNSYEHAIHVTMYFAIALAACAFVSSLFIKEKSLGNRP